MIKAIVAASVRSSGGLSYEYLINAPLEELSLILEEFQKIASQ